MNSSAHPPPMERLSDVARRLGGLLQGADASFARVITDTRQLQADDLFVALRGEHFDGHEFVSQAAALGAAGSLVDHFVVGPAEPVAPQNSKVVAKIRAETPAQIVVPKNVGTLAALQAYAKSWRNDFDLPVIGITGSSGKTTTKQLLASVMAARGPVLATEGNLNNHIGVPLTLLRLRAEHNTAVIEMGANHAGEIAQLAAIARPSIGIVTQAGDAHLEGFGSREGVAQAKGELFSALDGGVAVINADDRFAPLWRQLASRASVLSFGFDEAADVRAHSIVVEAEGSRFRLSTPAGDADVQLPLPGRHNIANALAAAAAGLAVGLAPGEIAKGLQQARAATGRLSWKRSREGARLLDDSYNANPTSLRAALDLLATLPGERWLVLGDMKELGANAPEIHEESGRTARTLGIDRVYTLGPLARRAAEGFGNGRAFDVLEDLVAALREDLGKNVSVLVKGSRSSRMERVVGALTGESTEGAH